MTVFVILGHRLKPRNKMTLSLVRRLQCFAYKPNDRVMVCGGNACGKACTHSEAYVMRAYLMQERGIPRDRIILENQSMNTVQNLRRMTRLCRKHRISRVRLITSNWHMPRVQAIWRALPRSGIGVVCTPSQDPVSLTGRYVREERRKLRAWRSVHARERGGNPSPRPTSLQA